MYQTLREETAQLQKKLNSKIKTFTDFQNNPEYYKQINRPIKEKVFGTSEVVKKRIENVKNIWDSEETTQKQLKKRKKILKFLLKAIKTKLITNMNILNETIHKY
jgi:septal ring factor EnvC (AmiA/AmiB activator)